MSKRSDCHLQGDSHFLISIEFFLHHFNIRRFQKVSRVLVDSIGHAVHDARNACIDKRFRAVDTRKMRHVARRAFGGDSVQRGLDDGIRLRVDRADAMPVHHEVTDLVAVTLSLGRAVEACGEDALVGDKHTADEGAVTGASF